MTSFYTEKELSELGLKSVGKNVLLSRKASLYGISRISIGNNSRIDDYCVLSAGKGGIQIGEYVHIAVFASLMGEGQIILDDFSGASSRVSIYSSNDDYSGEFMTNPTVPASFTNVNHADVFVGKHVVIGSGSVILPGVRIEEGVAIGALSLVKENCESFYIYTGNPARRIVRRSKELLNIESLIRNQ